MTAILYGTELAHFATAAAVAMTLMFGRRVMRLAPARRRRRPCQRRDGGPTCPSLLLRGL
jgi:hypothetical protein